MGKVVLLGNSGVGKTSFCIRAKHGFMPTATDASVGCDFFSVTVGEVRLLMWDTAGQEVYKTFTPNFCRKAIVALLFYDLTSYQSVEELEEWVRYTPDTAIIVVVPSKYDLSSSANPECLCINGMGRKVVNAKPISSAENINVQALLTQTADLVSKYHRDNYAKHVKLDEPQKDDKKCCRL